MDIEIINKPFNLSIHGFSGIAVNKDYAGTAFKLMDKMWQVVRSNGLKNKGINIWVYDVGDKVFAGVELDGTSKHDTGLEQISIALIKYGYYKHLGPYSLIKQAGQNMRNELQGMGFKAVFPYIEIYGHWTADETKLETELLMAID